jgi:hypothetical protein
LENSNLEDHEGDGRITLRCILGKQVVVMEGGWNWLKIMSNGWIWYYWY